jgi:hypothetical protein
MARPDELSVLMILYRAWKHDPAAWTTDDEVVSFLSKSAVWSSSDASDIARDPMHSLGKKGLAEVRRRVLSLGHWSCRITQAGVRVVRDELSAVMPGYMK